tara:strand:- start:1348 stop:1560 length:213 start_codon:yes stop_codon:yes gene_type:complete
MTYEQLALFILDTFSVEQKQQNVTVEVDNREFFQVKDLQETQTPDEIHGYVYEDEAVDILGNHHWYMRLR